MAIISEYEEDSEDVETIVRANLQDVGDDGYEDEEEDYPPDPYSSRPSDATSSERPYDEVLGYLLREHQQQPLDLLSTVIEFLFRETGIAAQEGVDVRVSEMLSAAKRRRVDTDDVEEGPDKIAKLDAEENRQLLSLSESTPGSSPISESSFQDKETVDSSPVEEQKNVVNVVNEEDEESFYEAPETGTPTPADDVNLTSNLAFEPEVVAVAEIPPTQEEETKPAQPLEIGKLFHIPIQTSMAMNILLVLKCKKT